MHGEGSVDERFNAVAMMEAFSWTYEEYLRRPLWIDTIYQLKLKAEAKYKEVNNPESNHE